MANDYLEAALRQALPHLDAASVSRLASICELYVGIGSDNLRDLLLDVATVFAQADHGADRNAA